MKFLFWGVVVMATIAFPIPAIALMVLLLLIHFNNES